MAKLLFKLNNVPDDEADEIRALLDQGEFDYYETSAGIWGLSFAAIWLKDEQQLDAAKEVINHYQIERSQRVHQEYEKLKASGQQVTRWQAFKRSPIKVVAVIIFISAVLYFSIIPFYPLTSN